MAPKTLLPLPSVEQRKGGWQIDVGFIKAIQTATESMLVEIDEPPSLEQVEAVLLASNAQFLRCWITAGGELPEGVEPKYQKPCSSCGGTYPVGVKHTCPD